MIMKPTHAEIRVQVQQALAEDIGSGDVTAQLIPLEQEVAATIISRENAILCGTDWVNEVFLQIDPAITVHWTAADGDAIAASQVLCSLKGSARMLLSGERTALNFLQTLSATATQTHEYVMAIAGTGCQILDTRKTIPGFRLAQKYAVGCGGGQNHRIGLYDMILIKENHILAAGSIHSAINSARHKFPGMKIEVEVETLEELHQAIECQADQILLDNMSIAMLIEAVHINQGVCKLEASGNVSMENVRKIAETGVDYISIGSITKHIRAIDLSMRIQEQY